MFALKFVKGLGLGSLGVVGVFLAILLVIAIYVAVAVVAALIPAWLVMVVVGACGLHWAYLATWGFTTIFFLLCGV